MREETVRHTHEGLPAALCKAGTQMSVRRKPRSRVSQSRVRFESEFGLPSLQRKSNALGVWGQPCWPKEEAVALMVHPQGHQP